MLAHYAHLAWLAARRAPVLTGLMLLAISVGIGAAMTTWTVIYLLGADPLPGRSQHIHYAQVAAQPNARSPMDMLDDQTAVDLWRAKRAQQQALLAFASIKVKAADSASPPQMLSTASTTADFFTMFDVPLRYGQAWSDADDAAHARVAVISSRLNAQWFGGKNSVGQTLLLGGVAVRIVGVLAPWRPSPLFYRVRGGRFSAGDTSHFYSQPDDLYLPYFTALDVSASSFQPFTCWAMPEQTGSLKGQPCAWVALWLRMRDDSQAADYLGFMRSYAAQQQAIGRLPQADLVRLPSLMQWLDHNRVVPSDVKLQAALALAFLVICLTNMMVLQLAKFLRYSGDIGLRRALGATRGAVFGQCLAESALIGVFGSVGGVVLTLLGLYLVRQQPVAYADLAHLNMPMLLAACALAVAASLLAGCLPAARAALIRPAVQLKLL